MRTITDRLEKTFAGGHSGKAEPLSLHRAGYVVPISRPPIEDGAVLTAGGSILEVASYRELEKSKPAGARVIDHGEAALIPCLVNAHAHLELSCMRGRISLPQDGFAAWLGCLFSERSALSQEELAAGFSRGWEQLSASGVGLVGDITNEAYLLIGSGGGVPVRHTFWEAIGFNGCDLRSALDWKLWDRTGANGDYTSLAAHACYSTSANIIQQAKEWCRMRKAPFSIHVAEHPEEIEFLQYGTGYCRDLLERLGKWVECWRPPRMTPVQYLDSLGVLDAGTLLVHAVHMSDSDWEIVVKRDCSVCFCPRSNININVGKPAIAAGLQSGIKACLGTDSLASNHDLSLFAEAAHVLDHYPDVPPYSLLVMMTKGGAQALGQSDCFGSLTPGGCSSFLSVQLDCSTPLNQLGEQIIYQGNQGAWKWVNHLRNS